MKVLKEFYQDQLRVFATRDDMGRCAELYVDADAGRFIPDRERKGWED